MTGDERDLLDLESVLKQTRHSVMPQVVEVQILDAALGNSFAEQFCDSVVYVREDAPSALIFGAITQDDSKRVDSLASVFYRTQQQRYFAIVTLDLFWIFAVAHPECALGDIKIFPDNSALANDLAEPHSGTYSN